MSHLIKLLLALLPVAALQAQHDDVLQVLKRIEANNLELQAARHATDAQKAEARTQLNLDNPELSFSAMKGPDNAKSHEFAIMQGFAFPTHYVAMNRQVKHQNAQADATHALVRRNILLQAHMLCLELIANEKLMLCLQRRDTTLAHLARLYDQAMKQGDVSAIDASRLATQQIALKADLQQARQQHTELHAQLQALNGGAPLNFSANRFPEASLPLDTAALFSHHLATHPLVRQSKAEADVAHQNISTTRTAALPSFGVGYKQSREGFATHRGVQLSMSIPLFAHRSRTKAAKAQAACTELQVKNQEHELRTALSEQWRRAEQLQLTLKQMPTHTLDQALTLLMQALEAQEITLQQYVQEQADIFNTLTQRIALELEYHKAIATLNQHAL